MGPQLTSPTATSRPDTGPYTEQFAAVLAEHSAPAPMPIEAARSVPARLSLSADDARHLPALKAAALGWFLLLGSGAASWYAIVGPMQRTSAIIPSFAATSPR